MTVDRWNLFLSVLWVLSVLGFCLFVPKGWIWAVFAKVRGKNSASTPTSVISAQMNEPRPLPMGVKEFHEWSDRIIAGAMVPAVGGEKSLKWALAEMIMHLKPTQDFCDDAYFIHCLRKGAVNQVAFAMMEEIRLERKAALAAEEAKAQASADVPVEDAD